MRTVDLITKKRDGGTHTDEELAFLVHGATRGEIPDYQMSAWLMAVVWRGLTDAETFALTRAMVESGEVLDLSGLPGVPVDKHSTGGVGDKTSLAVVPILASAGVPVAKMSGRGLGHTGGTLDKLEAIPGTRVQLSIPEILSQVRTVGACLCAQTDSLVPADKKLYALRDATGTVPSLPLIAASIMSKKIAGGSRAVVLDVKVGGGAFMKTQAEARALAALMIKIGQAHGQRVAAVLSDMDQPLGRAVGNLLEVREVLGLLQGSAEPRLREIVRTLAAVGFVLAGKAGTVEDGLALADRQVASGAASEKFGEIIAAQGGDADFLRHLHTRPAPAGGVPVRAPRAGYVSRVDAADIGLAAMRLGAGRATKEDVIDPTAGIILQKTVGDRIESDDLIATLFTRTEEAARAVSAQVRDAFHITDECPSPTPLLYETLGF